MRCCEANSCNGYGTQAYRSCINITRASHSKTGVRREGTVDKISSERRSENMRSIRSSNTKPELIVRRLVHSYGYRFRLHRKDLPGKPDLVFPSRKAVIFVHGCFWHMHGCPSVRVPKSNIDYWKPKLERNQERDLQSRSSLERLGWKVLTVWECEVKDLNALERKLKNFLSPLQPPP
ncbi:very short patch repair endonuclease [Noviherbaspirillum autotrophicum]|uniref:very short patch repair endonuclease n=1 Tax=Noviherbaspirillum autotrophicum TaxID=709839 RepID=UPI000A03E283|nr:very short patch repair endonuclease [Noviherbaspirillum autotrophicum]